MTSQQIQSSYLIKHRERQRKLGRKRREISVTDEEFIKVKRFIADERKKTENGE